MKDISDIEKIVGGIAFLVAAVAFGKSTWFETEPIKATLMKGYEKVYPEARKPIEAAISRAYENAKMTGKSLRKSFYNNNSLIYY